MYDPKSVDELEFELNRPLCVLKMNRASNAAGAGIRAENARIQIHKLIEEYARKAGK
jgi:hypothetical protein